MTTKAFVGRIFFARGDGGSPESFVRVCQVNDISGVGVKKDQVDVTNFCSDGSKEYIAGLADGQELTAKLNFETGTTGVIIDTMEDDVDTGTNKRYQLQCEGTTKGVVDKIYEFDATPLSWVIGPSVAKQNTIDFGFKISGKITRTTL